MASTFKVALCAAVLDQVAAGKTRLTAEITVRPSDLLDYAPVTTPQVGQAMTVADLCQATVDMSDNTAANLLLSHIGGPEAVTAFLRRSGDMVTRLDRMEPEMNRVAQGDPRDTTSPEAMVQTWQRLFLGDALNAEARDMLWHWASTGGVTQALLRAHLPAGWEVADKSGAGEGARGLVAIVAPPERAPFVLAIYLAESPADFPTRNAAVQEIAAELAALMQQP